MSTSAPVMTMSAIVRVWLSFAALGTALIHFALALDAPLALAATLGALGLVEFAWGIVAFVRDPVAPRAAIAVAILPIVAWGVLLPVVVSAGMREVAASLDLLPLAVASLFELFIVAVLGSHLRRDSQHTTAKPSTARYVVGVAAGALVVAALTGSALAAAQVGVGASVLDPTEFESPEHGTEPEH